MFIIPLIASIIALFKIDENKAILEILTIIAVLFLGIFIFIKNIEFVKEYITQCINKNKIDYESLRDELYNILLTSDLKQDLYSKIKDFFF